MLAPSLAEALLGLVFLELLSHKPYFNSPSMGRFNNGRESHQTRDAREHKIIAMNLADISR